MAAAIVELMPANCVEMDVVLKRIDLLNN